MIRSWLLHLGCVLLSCHDGNAPSNKQPIVSSAPPSATTSTNPLAPSLHRDADSDAAAPSAAKCPATPWAEYAHDAARTSSSDGCITGPLTIAWKLARQGTCGFKFRPGRILHVIGDEQALFASLDCGGAPAIMRVTPDGKPLWTFGRGDYGRGTWPALTRDAIVSVDDGVFLVDREMGKFQFRELDVWGEPIVDGDTFFVANTFQLDSAGPFLGAIDASLKWSWRANAINPGKGKDVARIGGIALANGTIIHAAAMGARGVPSIAAFDARTGDLRWTAPRTFPVSAPSIGGDRAFIVEQWTGEKGNRLVARALADGAVLWSEPTPWARGPSPVVIEKLVLIHGAEGVRAHDRDTGTLAWKNATPRKAAWEEAATSMAAAKGTRTVAVTSGGRVLILRLEDGAEQWSGTIVEGSSPTSIGGLAVGRPVIIGRALYVTSDGLLLRLDSTEGR